MKHLVPNPVDIIADLKSPCALLGLSFPPHIPSLKNKKLFLQFSERPLRSLSSLEDSGRGGHV